MRIALLGGTGDIGQGLALRWAYDTDHEVIIGSRDPEKARTKATEYETELDSLGVSRSINGFANGMAAERGDMVVLAVPPFHIRDTIEAVADRLDDVDVLVTPAVGMDRDETGFHYKPPNVGSVSELVADTAPDGVPVVGAFHNLSADRLADLSLDLDQDTLLVGDDDDAKELVGRLAEEIDGLRALDAGGIGNSAEVESMTPLLINLALENEGMHDVGVRFE
ncbi:NADPH-dependent F420 reductase [Haladaptatus paucihalophilus DX253]|uniref:NADPH-dependent F420 reductase n=1 Tax=Haladaptatus paucihalophilus DX253 TaxID=797209 RepID=E7QU00_HALPU|nr:MULTISPECIES: NADPH-dependent F420 reductase [Haladaptatus]EFW92079.1 NADPH-dependent F420 reductase [Haladaptatus paucihalophilus DX253]GKZ14232.1 NADPH-dependent F420 reductase [Haladaptatus sp. T7]SHK87887.1 reduced coenzyme F420:NADP oxidoreductase [Haladaptatus paucihalophilus DX253]